MLEDGKVSDTFRHMFVVWLISCLLQHLVNKLLAFFSFRFYVISLPLNAAFIE